MRRRRVSAGAVAALALILGACGVSMPEQGRPEPQFNGPVPVRSATPVDQALACLARQPEVRRTGLTYAVHTVQDLTNKYVVDEDGAPVPRDVAGMLVTQLAKAGVQQVNRSNTAVSEWEIAQARAQLLGDGTPTLVGGRPIPFRPLNKGVVLGSDIVIDGAITQLDYNTYSNVVEANVSGIGGGRRAFALTVGADLRVTDTRTTRIVLARSYAKQAVGTEISASIFRFFGEQLFDVKIGDKSQEGLHAGIRWMLGEAAYDIVATLSRHDGSCDRFLPEMTRKIREEFANGQHVDVPLPAAAAGAPGTGGPIDDLDPQETGPAPGPVNAAAPQALVRFPDGRTERVPLTPELRARGQWNADRTVFIVTAP